MRCERCGRDNPEHLTFCEDCGFALARRKEAARPTPGAGTGVVRPQAPNFQIGPPSGAQSDGLTCKACHTRNEPGHRFCVACGTPLPGAQVPMRNVSVERPRAPTPPTGIPQPAEGIAAAAAAQAWSPLAAAPMVAVAPAQRPAAETVCPRCRTSADAGTMYCRVCGYSLGAPQQVAPTAAAPEASVAPPTPIQPPAQAAPAPAPNVAPTPQPPKLEIVQPETPPAGANGSAPAPQLLTKTVALGVPAVKTQGRLVVLAKDGSDGASFSLTGDAIDVGAREGAVVLPEDPYLSPRHARLQEERGKWWVVDLGSVNGVYLRVRAPRELADGDLILLGQEVLRFEVVMDAEQALGAATQHGVALFGTPQTPRYARLCQRTVEGVTRDVFHLSRAETSLGREGADIVFGDDPFLSRRHAVIRHDAATRTFTLEDAGSSNGTFAAIRGRAPLSDGDILRMGLHVFRVELTKSATASDDASRSGAANEGRGTRP